MWCLFCGSSFSYYMREYNFHYSPIRLAKPIDHIIKNAVPILTSKNVKYIEGLNIIIEQGF